MKHKTLGLSAAILAAISIPFTAAQDDAGAYQEGYGLILQQRWSEARNYFQDFQSRWVESAWRDDAAFWECYALEQSGVPEAETFDCYESFVSTFTQSSWAEDARSKMFVIADRMSERGNPAFMDRARVMEDEDFDFDWDIDIDEDRITAEVSRALAQAQLELERFRDNRGPFEFPPMPPLPPLDSLEDAEQMREMMDEMRSFADRQRQVLRRRGRNSADDELLTILSALRSDERASDLLLQRLDSSDDPALRARIVLLLEDVGGQAITRRLMDVAQNDADQRVRNNAIIVLLDREAPESRELLLSIAGSADAPLPIRAEIIDEMDDTDDWSDSEVLPVLEDILGNAEEPVLMHEAAEALADRETEASVAILLRSYESQQNPQLRRVLLEAIAEVESAEVMNLLSGEAINAEDDELASIAIEGIADREDNVAATALQYIYANTDSQTRRLAAIHGLGDTETQTAVEALAGIVAETDNPVLLAEAAEALGDTERETAIPVLLDIYAASADERVQRAALNGLRELNDYPAATDAMLRILEQRLDAETGR